MGRPALPLLLAALAAPKLACAAAEGGEERGRIAWQVVHANQPESAASPTVRYGHAAVVLGDLMVSTHGYFYNHPRHRPDWRDDSWAFSLSEHWFAKIHLKTGANAKASFYPTSVAYRGKIFMFGGDNMIGDGTKGHHFGGGSDEVWRLAIDPIPSYPMRFLSNNLLLPALKLLPGRYERAFMNLIGEPFKLRGEWHKVHGGSRSPKNGPSPSPRACHAATVVDNMMVVHAGFNRSDMWSFNLDQFTWTQLHGESNEGPGSRFSHTIVTYDDRIWLYGGNLWGLRDKARSDVWVYDVKNSNPSWTLVSDGSSAADGTWPPQRAHHTAAVMREAMFVMGGLRCPNGPCTCREDTWRFNFTTLAWTELPTQNNPTPRYSHSMVHWEDSLYVFGGESMKPYMYHNEVKMLPLKGFESTQDEL